jgi:hypothetical protein
VQAGQTQFFITFASSHAFEFDARSKGTSRSVGLDPGRGGQEDALTAS